MKYQNWLSKNTSSLNGKTVAITGATGGIGVKLCEYFAYLGANLICLDRNCDKSNKLIADLKHKFPYLNAVHITVDLENIEAVKDVSNKLKLLDIDYLVLNAGAYKIPRHKCSTGYDNVFQINFISPYYLARELEPQFSSRGGKIVAVSSIAHNYSKIDVSDVDFSTRSASSLVYGNAKRFLTLSLYSFFQDKNYGHFL
jgi:NAD(P)-dependent dehydrogenase (short-subunit alcohol dehydrogenase family)